MATTAILIANVHHRLGETEHVDEHEISNGSRTYIVLEGIGVEQKSAVERSDGDFSTFVAEINGGDQIRLSGRYLRRCLSRYQCPVNNTFVGNVP